MSQLSLLGEHDLHLFNEGTHRRTWEKLGAHVVERGAVFEFRASNVVAEY